MPPMPKDRLEALLTLAPAQRWGIYLTDAMLQAGLGPSELTDLACAIKPKIFGRSNVTHWRNGKSTAEPERVIVIARVLHLDGIEALRIAGHDAVAEFAAKMRADSAAAIVGQELAAVEDDPYFGQLDRWAARGVITTEERDRRRAVHLEDKKRDTAEIAQIYAAEVERIHAESDEPNGTPEHAAR